MQEKVQINFPCAFSGALNLEFIGTVGILNAHHTHHIVIGGCEGQGHVSHGASQVDLYAGMQLLLSNHHIDTKRSYLFTIDHRRKKGANLFFDSIE